MYLHRHNFDYDNYVEFSKWTQDRIIGTKEEKAHVSICKIENHKKRIWFKVIKVDLLGTVVLKS